MKSSLKQLILATTLLLTTFLVKADDQSDIPATSWMRHPNGISMDLDFIDWMEGGHQKHDQIRVYIKNTSNSEKYFLFNGQDRGIQLFYINKYEKRTPLHDYTEKSNGIILASIPPLPIKPGQVLVQAVDLTVDDISIVNQYPILCRFYISDQEIGGFQSIESTPKKLTEKVVK